MSAPIPETDRSEPTDATEPAWRPLRVWPGLIIIAAIPPLMIVPGLLLPRTMVHFAAFFAAPILGTLAVVGWWVFAARVRGRDRWLFPVLLLVPAVGLTLTLFPTTLMAVPVYALPLVAAVWVIAAALTAGLSPGDRRGGLVAVLLGGWAVVGLTRFDGADADLVPAFRWRWQKTSEEIFVAERPASATPAADARPVVVGQGDWPGFRGPDRDSRVPGVVIDTDWAAHPPELVWEHRVGPGWGSFAVADGRLFTQEQRGKDETVVCYAADTGREVWEHREPARFEEAIGGAGPRATPTIHDGRVYAQGATGKLICLDAATGRPHWTADLTADVGGVVPQWGFASSPLVTEGLVIVYAGGPGGKGTVAYKMDTGQVAWAAGKAAHSYSSAQRATLGGVPQVLMVSDYGVESFRPADGQLLWEHVVHVKGVNRVVQPAVLSDTELVFGTGVGSAQGTRRLRVTRTEAGWDVRTAWTTRAIKPYFNDGVVHEGHLYGFDDSRFCCVDLGTGAEVWKEGQYGHGQVLLLSSQGLLIVQAVDGSIALVEANPAGHNELAKFPALKGKTWNHPVIAHGMLFVRNGQEAACYRLRTK
ncbi:MAG: repeat-like protein [Gemmataceae bacterium]|nr:repeat-like protein [Gemmataceae bacterium]